MSSVCSWHLRYIWQIVTDLRFGFTTVAPCGTKCRCLHNVALTINQLFKKKKIVADYTSVNIWFYWIIVEKLYAAWSDLCCTSFSSGAVTVMYRIYRLYSTTVSIKSWSHVCYLYNERWKCQYFSLFINSVSWFNHTVSVCGRQSLLSPALLVNKSVAHSWMDVS